MRFRLAAARANARWGKRKYCISSEHLCNVFHVFGCFGEHNASWTACSYNTSPAWIVLFLRCNSENRVLVTFLPFHSVRCCVLWPCGYCLSWTAKNAVVFLNKQLQSDISVNHREVHFFKWYCSYINIKYSTGVNIRSFTSMHQGD